MKVRIAPSAILILIALSLVTLSSARTDAQPFTEIDPGLPKSAFPCVAWGDFDGDGDLDVLVAGSGRHDVAFSTIYRNNGGTFTDSGIVLLGLARATAAWGDFDGDGDLDLAMTGLEDNGAPNGPTRTRIYRNNGATFALVPGSPLGVFAGSVAWGDYDGDGDLDLLVTGVTTATAGGVAATRLYRNAAGTFTAVAHPFPDCYLGAAAWGDYDNDGDLDLVLTGAGAPALVSALWRNDGGGVFTDAGAGLPGMDLGFAAWGDYDNDGDLDLLLGGDSSVGGPFSRIYRNDVGTLVDAHAGLQSLLWSSAAWGDYDNDGDLDAMLFGYDAVAQVTRSMLYRNDAGAFVDSGATFHNLFLGTLSWADYDNDGDLDLSLAGNTSGLDVFSLYRNNALTPNAAPGAPGNLAVSYSGTRADFSWSAASDDHTPGPGLSYNLRLGTTPGGAEIVSPQSGPGGYRRLAALGNAQSGLGARVGPLQPGTTYYWSVQAVDASFAGSAFAVEGSFTFSLSGVDEAVSKAPATLRALPNPFTGSTTLSLAGSAAMPARVMIFDVRGRLVRTLETGRPEGNTTMTWDGRDQAGRDVPDGVYLSRGESSIGAVSGRLVKTR